MGGSQIDITGYDVISSFQSEAGVVAEASKGKEEERRGEEYSAIIEFIVGKGRWRKWTRMFIITYTVEHLLQ